MNDRGLMVLSTILGGVVGAGVGFVVFTKRGRALRAELQPELESLLTETMRLGQALEDLRSSARKSPDARSVTGPRRAT